MWGTATYRIPASVHYDGASVPRVAWMFITTPYAPRVMAAALVHDWLYLTHHVDRETADTIFLWMLELTAMSRWRRAIMYYALRCCGWWAWTTRKRDAIRLQQLKARLRRKRLPLSRYRLGSQETADS